MSVLSRLIVALGLDAADYEKGLSKADSATDSKLTSMGSKLQSIGSSMTDAGKKLTAGVTLPIAAMGVLAVDAASDLEESLSKVGVVFGDAAGDVVTFSEGAAEGLGQSQQQALEAAGTFGNLFVSMGMAPGAAADMSTSLVTLGSDLASFNNTMPIEALEALRAGLTGETEPLKRYGVNINAAAVAQKALDLGLVSTSVDMVKVEGATLKLEKAQAKATEAIAEFGEESMEAREANQAVAEAQAGLEAALAGTVNELTSAEKAQAVYALVMEQTATAQGDFARTADGLANSTRIAKAQLADAASTMGAQLLPIGLKVVGFVSDLVSKFANLDEGTQKIILIVAGLAAALGPVLMIAGPLTSGIGALAGALGAAGLSAGALGTALLPIIAVVGAIVGAVLLFKAAWDNNWLGIRDTLTAIWENTLKPALMAIWDWLKLKVPQAIATLKMWWDTKLLPAIKTVWEWIKVNLIPLFQSLWRLLKVTLAKALEILAGIWQNVLKPALMAVWQVIQDKIIPVFQSVIEWVKDKLGPPLQWLKEHVVEPLAGAFDAIGGAIQWVIDKIEWLIGKIKSVDLPWWMQPGSPTPWELGLRGVSAAMRDLSRADLPELQMAITAVGKPAWALDGGQGGMGLQGGGDTIIVHNHGAPAAALTMARIEERRRARLNRSMG